jgi:NAD(P)-dependent dehydrogenase (short-subunit alcohol dehydrogenase family)
MSTVVFVTGGAFGIGEAIGRTFAERGRKPASSTSQCWPKARRRR